MRGPQPVEEPRGGGAQYVRLSAGQELTLKMLENKLAKIGELVLRQKYVWWQYQTQKKVLRRNFLA
jgi:hypothetical protein